MTRRVRVLVSGHYGAGNVGDEAISVALAWLARDSAAVADLVILSHSPQDTERICQTASISHPTIGAGGLRNLRVMIEEVKKADVVLIGGGGIFQDEFNLRTIPKYSLPAIVAAWTGTPYVLYAVGVGPLTSGYGQRLTRLVASGAAGVTVRDEASRKLIADLGIINSEIVPDPANYLKTTDATHTDWVTNLIETELRGKDFVLLSLRAIWHTPSTKNPGLTWLPDAAISDLITQLRAGLDRIGCKVVILPAYLGQDSEIGKKMAEAIGDIAILIDKELAPNAWLQLIDAASLVISMPLHPALLACANGTPALTIAYASKVREQMEIWGLGQYVVSLGSFEKIPDYLSTLWASRHEEAARLREMGIVMRRDVVEAFNRSTTPNSNVQSKRRLSFALGVLTAFGWVPEFIRRQLARPKP